MNKQITITKIKEGLRATGLSGAGNNSLIKIRRTRSIVVIENYSTGTGHSAHANIDETGSVTGMKKSGYWNRSDRVIKAMGFYYNFSSEVVSDELDLLALRMEQGLKVALPKKIGQSIEVGLKLPR